MACATNTGKSSFFQQFTVQLLQVKAPFPPVGSFQLKISQFPVPLLYFFHSTHPPATPPLLTISAGTPLLSQPIPSPPTPTCIMDLQHTLKKCTIGKKIKYPVHFIYSVLHKHNNKTGKRVSSKQTINNFNY